MRTKGIPRKVVKEQRLSPERAVVLFREAGLLELAAAADTARRDKHPREIATFLIDRNINYTNICRNKCSFCAFYRPQGHPEAYVLSQDEIEKKIAETIELGGTQIMLQGGINPELTLNFYKNMLSEIKRKFRIRIHSLSPPEVMHIAESEGMSVADVLTELTRAGLDSLPGGGAEILVDSVRQRISPRKISSAQWLGVMEEAHRQGVTTTATMMFGTGETIEDRISHLAKIRDLQDKTRGFISFIPWTFQPNNTSLGGRAVSSIEYLRMLSISRLFLDNVPNVQGSWVTQGRDIGQICLSFGANDLGSIMIEENVVKAAGIAHRITVEEMVDLIRKAGKIPAQRDTEFNIVKIYA
jgi:cyclic dehypoxanthinyl futalosine synthase